MRSFLFRLFGIGFLVSIVFAHSENLQNINYMEKPMSTILKVVYDKGYTDVREIEREHNSYEIVALDINRQLVNLRLDIGGNFISEYSPQYSFSLLDAIIKLEDTGFAKLLELDWEGDRYEFELLDKENKKIKLFVDANTGKIMNEFHRLI